ncbi:MAG: alanine racemase [Endomicrobiia bacterium]
MNKNLFSRPILVEINLKNLQYNIRQIKKVLSKKTKILAVVKTNAYGHGLIEVTKACLKERVDFLGVTSVEEGIQLREKNIKLPILILGTLFPFENFKYILRYNLIPTIASISGLESYSYYSKKLNKKGVFHLKIDTGMGRIGISPESIDKFLERYLTHKNLLMEGVFTHFSSADSDDEYTLEQINIFDNAIKKIRKIFPNSNLIVHACNSSGMLKFQQAHYSMVRSGLCIYGLKPFEDSHKFITTKPVLSWKAKIVFLKKVPEGKSISYGRTFITKKPTLVATIPVGYGDGYNRKLSNRGYVFIKNKIAPVIGRVTMDMTMIDVTDIKNVKIGDEVSLIDSEAKIYVEDMAKLVGTINYEIVCNIHPRVPRIYAEE